MALFLSMLPVYLFGNLHCLGMCGPLVALIGHHRFRSWYFAGRTLAFASAAGFAGLLGAVLNAVLNRYHVAAATSLLFGVIILVVSLSMLAGWRMPGGQRLFRLLAPLNQRLSTLMLRDRRWPTFLFGLATVLLPCGQTVIVYSACALVGDPLVGFLNGAAFALITSPSLVLAMHSSRLFARFKQHYNTLIGLAGIAVALLAIGRGCAELDLISHFVLNPNSHPNYHIVLF